jgi:hypothetical protein
MRARSTARVVVALVRRQVGVALAPLIPSPWDWNSRPFGIAFAIRKAAFELYAAARESLVSRIEDDPVAAARIFFVSGNWQVQFKLF